MSDSKAAEVRNRRSVIADKLRASGLIFKVALASVFILALAFSFRQIDSPDIGLHLAPGKWILSHRAFPTTEVFTYGAAQGTYVDLYWSYQVMMALFDRMGGAFLLVLANALVMLAALVVFVRRSWVPTATSKLILLFVTLIVVYTANYEIRPHVMSWLLLGLLLLTWEGYFEDAKRSLIAVPLIMILWVNIQPTFILGWIVIGSFWISLAVRDKRIDRRATLFAMLGFLAGFVNPYFFKGVALPFLQFGFLQPESVFKGLIAEYSPLPFLPGREDVTYFGSLLLFRPMFILQLFRIGLTVLVLIQLLRRRLWLHEGILFALFFYLNSIAEKNVGYFIMMIGPTLIRSFSRSSNAVEPRRETKKGPALLAPTGDRFRGFFSSPRLPEIFGMCFILASIGLTLRVVTNDFYSSQRLSHRFGFAYNNLFLPVKAANFLTTHRLEGRVLNHIDFGGALLDRLPQKIYIDGRNEVMGESLAQEYLLTYSPDGLKQLVGKYAPDIIIFPHKEGASWLEYVQSDTTTWRLVYFDELAAVYLRKGYAEAVTRLTEDAVWSSLDPLSGEEADSILNRGFGQVFFAQFIRDQYFPVRESELSAFCSDIGWDRLAIIYGVEAVQRSTVPCPEFFYNLSIYFQKIGDKQRAGFCLRRASES
ncbi:MAG TPA: hypothetical protein VMH23_19335 [Bacteroidota bacterium]|nr:hypothetical protein [Bacteroidota bacterium]